MSFEEVTWLAQTKFICPTLRPDVLLRPRLALLIRQNFTTGRVTLVSAPAGYGKTTFLSSLPQIFPEMPLSWVALDEGDNAPLRLIVTITTALKQLNPVIGQGLQTFLVNSANPPFDLSRLASWLVNEVMASLTQPFILVLDDLHWLSAPEVYTVLDYLIERLPGQMHLVIGTRYDPPLALARLRVRTQLVEIRSRDLRFTGPEVASFLNEKLQLKLSADDLTTLQNRTEGWAAGLRLFASSFDRIDNQPARSSFIHNLLQTEEYLYDFLAEEVLNQQAPAMRSFLLETSILTELTPPLCQAVTRRQEAGRLLEELYRRNLTVAVEPSRQVYRYHDLFGEFLRQRLTGEQPDRLQELHRRAAEAEPIAEHSIRHYLTAQFWEEAADKMEVTGKPLLQQGLLETVHGWLYALPPEVRANRPKLLYLRAFYFWQIGDVPNSTDLLEQALHGFEVQNLPEEQGEALVMLSNTLTSLGDSVRGRYYTEQALKFPLSPDNRALLLMTKVWQNFWSHDWEPAIQALDEAIQLAVQLKDPIIINTLALQVRCYLFILPDGLARLERYHRVFSTFLTDDNLLLKTSLTSLQGFSHLLRGRLDEAVPLIEQALEGSVGLEGTIWLNSEIAITSFHVYIAQENYAAFDKFLALFLRRFGQNPFFQTYYSVWGYFPAFACWQQGKLDETRQIYQAMRQPTGEDSIPDAWFTCFLVEALLEISQKHYPEAEKLILKAREIEPAISIAASMAASVPLLALLYLKWNQLAKALAEIEPLLKQTERDNTPGSARPLLLMAATDWHKETWNGLTQTVRGAVPAFERLNHLPFFDYLGQNGEASLVFNEAMSGYSSQVAAAVVAAYNFSRYKKVVDVGGGIGNVMIPLLKKYPKLQGLIFDLPQVVDQARSFVAVAGLQERCELVGGSFFEGVPAGADAYLVNNVLHDWSDAKCLEILRSCRRTMDEKATLLLSEQVLPDAKDTSFHIGKITDMEMGVFFPGGRERTLEEFKQLCESTGFKLVRAVATPSFAYVMECVPL